VADVQGHAVSSNLLDEHLCGPAVDLEQEAIPVFLAEQIIRAFTKEGDTVCDPFCGSGSTLVAAQQLGRRYVGFDLWRDAYDEAVRRLAAPEDLPVRFKPAYRTVKARKAYIKSLSCGSPNRVIIFEFIVRMTIYKQVLLAPLSSSVISAETRIDRRTVINCLNWLQETRLIVRTPNQQSHHGISSLTGIHQDLLA